MIPKFRVWDENQQIMRGVRGLFWKKNNLVVHCSPMGDKFDKFFTTILSDGAIPMQSTGLKDKNGKEIFEGDVVKCYTVTEEGESEYVGVVCFKDFSFVIVDKKDTYDPLWNYKGGFVTEETEIEIIGDIYRNPELVEEK